MKKFFMIVLAVVIGLAFVTTTFAQDKAPAKAADKPTVAAEKDKAPADQAADAKDKKPPKKAKKKAPKKEEKKDEAKKDEAKKDEAKPAPAK